MAETTYNYTRNLISTGWDINARLMLPHIVTALSKYCNINCNGSSADFIFDPALTSEEETTLGNTIDTNRGETEE